MGLTTRERFVRTMTGQDVDRVPFIKLFGGSNAVLTPWLKHHPLLHTYIDELLQFEGGYRGWRITPVNFWLSGVEEEAVISETDKKIVSRKGDGTVTCRFKYGDYHQHIVEYPVKSQGDWDRIASKYLNPYDPARIPQDWENLCDLYRRRDFPLQLTCGGVYGFLRTMMGDEALCYAMYDDPELIERITGDYIDMCLALWEVLCQNVDFDLIECWEDMAGKTGSVISPVCFEKFLAPQFRKIRAFADAYYIPIVMVDSDGYIDDLSRWLSGCGVNAIYPFEVGAGCDARKVRDTLPELGMLGCLEKNACAAGDEAIEAQLEVAKMLIRKGRYIPGPDHFVLENVTFEGYYRFMRRLREIIFTVRPGS